MTNNKTRQMLAAQKLRLETTPRPIEKLPPLTAEQRREIYAPKPYTAAPQQLQGAEWVATWKSVSRVSYGLTAFISLLFGGLVAKETRKATKL